MESVVINKGTVNEVNWNLNWGNSIIVNSSHQSFVDLALNIS